jgi:hypothetical protein
MEKFEGVSAHRSKYGDSSPTAQNDSGRKYKIAARNAHGSRLWLISVAYNDCIGDNLKYTSYIMPKN